VDSILDEPETDGKHSTGADCAEPQPIEAAVLRKPRPSRNRSSESTMYSKGENGVVSRAGELARADDHVAECDSAAQR
jgi:hypothetical protein